MREAMKYENPCIKQISETSCASADYTMVANALNLNNSLEEILQVTKSEIGFAPFWKWLVEKNNIEIVDFTENDLQSWAENGFSNFSQNTDPKVSKFFCDRIKNPQDYQNNLQSLFKNENFKFNNQKPSVDLLKEYFSKNYVCDVMLDPWWIYGEEPEFYSLHRVFITDINGDEITFRDPSDDSPEIFKSNTTNFDKAFEITGAELTCYKIIGQ
jgi:hypothetical protein